MPPVFIWRIAAVALSVSLTGLYVLHQSGCRLYERPGPPPQQQPEPDSEATANQDDLDDTGPVPTGPPEFELNTALSKTSAGGFSPFFDNGPGQDDPPDDDELDEDEDEGLEDE